MSALAIPGADQVAELAGLPGSRRRRVLQHARRLFAKVESQRTISCDEERRFWGAAAIRGGLAKADTDLRRRRARRAGFRHFDPADAEQKSRIRREIDSHPLVKGWAKAHPYSDCANWRQWIEDFRQVKRRVAIQKGLTPPERLALFLIDDDEADAYNRGEWGRESADVTPGLQRLGQVQIQGACQDAAHARLLSVQRRDGPADAEADPSIALQERPAAVRGPGVHSPDARASSRSGSLSERPTSLAELSPDGRRRMVAFAAWLRRAAGRAPVGSLGTTEGEQLARPDENLPGSASPDCPRRSPSPRPRRGDRSS